MDKLKELLQKFISALPFQGKNSKGLKSEFTHVLKDLKNQFTGKIKLPKKAEKEKNEAPPEEDDGKTKNIDLKKVQEQKEDAKDDEKGGTKEKQEGVDAQAKTLSGKSNRSKAIIAFVVVGMAYLAWDEMNNTENAQNGKKNAKHGSQTTAKGSKGKKKGTANEGEESQGTEGDAGKVTGVKVKKGPSLDEGDLGKKSTGSVGEQPQQEASMAPPAQPADGAPSGADLSLPDGNVQLNGMDLNIPDEAGMPKGVPTAAVANGTNVDPSAVGTPSPVPDTKKEGVKDTAKGNVRPADGNTQEMDILKERNEAKESRGIGSVPAPKVMNEIQLDGKGGKELNGSVDNLQKIVTSMDQQEGEKKMNVYPTPDYDRIGRGLVYNCDGKHWACLDKEEFFECKNGQIWSKQIGKKPACVIEEVYFSNDDCNRAQTIKVNAKADSTSCNN